MVDVLFAKVTRDLRLWAGTFDDDMVSAIRPEFTVTRYRKTWRFSRPERLATGVLAGRMGFVREAAAVETTYDEDLQDFVTTEGQLHQGSVSNFVIDASSEVLAFEAHPPDVRVGSFLNNFKALLAEADVAVRLDLLTDPTEFGRWASSLDRLERIRAVVYRPNPGWNEDAALIRQAVTEANARKAELIATSDRDESLDADAPWVTGALHQIAGHGQGRLTATGTSDGERQRWDSGHRHRVVSRPEDLIEPRDVWNWMRARLRDFYGG